jgi:eukaryotic-like serine/threonine-protein kinase
MWRGRHQRLKLKDHSDSPAFQLLHHVHELQDIDVYEAVGRDGTRAALKIAAETGHTMREILTEADLLKRARGLPAPAFLATGTFESRAYLAMEWCDGCPASDLSCWIRRGGCGSVGDKLLTLCANVAAAYGRLHDRGIIQGDVQPKNVIVSRNGEVRLIGFSRACDLNASDPQPRYRPGSIESYCDPETAVALAAGSRLPQAREEAEQYAVGALLYLLITGSYYFEFSPERRKVLTRIAQDTPKPFIDRGLPEWPDLEAVIARMLAKQPGDRFESVGHAAGLLRQIATPVSWESIGRPVSRRRKGEPLEVLNSFLQRASIGGWLLEAGLSRRPTASVHYGAAGIAYALYRIARLWGDETLSMAAEVWAARACRQAHSRGGFASSALDIRPAENRSISIHHAEPGVHLIHALIAQSRGNMGCRNLAINAFLRTSAAPGQTAELSWGWAGTLLGCSLLIDAIGSDDPLCQQVFTFGNRILANLRPKQPSGESEGTSFLGMAHGEAGILYSALRWSKATAEALPMDWRSRLDALAGEGVRSGEGTNWPLTRPVRGSESQYWPGWCHGSAGYAFLWCLAAELYGLSEAADLAERSARAAWSSRDNTTPDLCCGAAGRAYANLSVYRLTGERIWRRRARELFERAAQFAPSSGPLRDSLYKGDVGIALLAAEIDAADHSAMPLLEEEA